jgi:hypothetical protein
VELRSHHNCVERSVVVVIERGNEVELLMLRERGCGPTATLARGFLPHLPQVNSAARDPRSNSLILTATLWCIILTL